MKLFWVTFLTIFLAELGDKTQLATLVLSAKSANRWLIFAGSAGALVLAAALGVLAGKFIGEHLPVKFLKISSGLVFIGIGLAILLGKF